MKQAETSARGLKAGILGLPNVGKSTLFNALMEESQAQAANFPFCTIEPNVGVVQVPDPRLERISSMAESEKTVQTSLAFVDIAGLVRGASKGEGLGNKFLGNVRECDALVHVVRCFEDDDIIHVDESVDPVRDIATINLELILSDLEQVERSLAKVKKGVTAEQKEMRETLSALQEALSDEKPARAVLPTLSAKQQKALKSLGLLSAKPMVYAANVGDADLADGNEFSSAVVRYAQSVGDAEVVLVSAQVESELIELDADERRGFLEDLGVGDGTTGLPALIRAAYRLLNLQTFYTMGPTESRAWPVPVGATAPKAGATIHTDFERGFIRAETVAYEDLITAGSEKAAREKGLMRSEGKDYVVQDGDVILFRFNV